MFKRFIILVAAFAYFGSQISGASEYDTAKDTVDSFEKLFGVSKGKRRNHTKGFCFEADFIPEKGQIQNLSTSALFVSNSSVVGRLSHKGGNANAADNKMAEFGMGLSFSNDSGEPHLMSMNTLDFFPVATPEAFAELMRAKAAGKDAVKAFKAKSADLRKFKAYEANSKKELVAYEGSQFNSVNSFYLVDRNGKNTAVRWSFVPSQKHSLVVAQSQNFLFDNIKQNLKETTVSWDMIVTIANPDDVVDNATMQWQGEHQKVLAGRLRIKSVSSEAEGRCDSINFDPLVLSKGFQGSNDPLLKARSTSYAITFGRRMAEKLEK